MVVTTAVVDLYTSVRLTADWFTSNVVSLTVAKPTSRLFAP